MKKLVVTLVIVLGLLVVADYGAASVAEYQVSQKVREQLKLDEDPSVRVHGFPFLTQAVAGDYQDVELAAKAVRVGELSELGVEANLHHARVALGDVIAGKADEIQVDELVGRVKLKASDVGRYIGITDLTINPHRRTPSTNRPTETTDRAAPPGPARATRAGPRSRSTAPSTSRATTCG